MKLDDNGKTRSTRGLFLDGGCMRFEAWDYIEAGDIRPSEISREGWDGL